nr:NADH dehydrogenase subunit 2 [Phytobia cambii]
MFNNSYKIMFLLILMMGTLITISSNSWLSAWMGLEINLLSFIPLMNDNNLMSTESSLKYFLTQALASTIFLFTSMFLLMEMYYCQMNSIYSKMLLLSSLLLKMGAAPFHFWFPNVMQGLSWLNSLILMTWQKIAPFILISYTLYSPMILFCSIMSAIMGSIGGLNQTSLFKLMAYSSINHMSWMLISLLMSELMWLIYFLIYSFLNLSMILLFMIFNLFHINQLFMISLKSKMLKFLIFMNFLSLGGLPPFMGFIPKLMVIQYLTMNNQLLMMFLLILSSLITLFFYLRLSYTSFMLNHNEINWNMNIKYNMNYMNIYFICSSFSIGGLIMISLMYLIF